MHDHEDEEFMVKEADLLELGYRPSWHDYAESCEPDFETVLDDLYEDREDYARSEEGGWFYDE
jgi:hypothetical protein